MNDRSVATVSASTSEIEADPVDAQTLGQLGAQIAHDFNNVLAVALTSVEMAMRTDDRAKANVFLGNALKVIARGRVLTDRLAVASHACESATLIDATAMIRDICRAIEPEVSGSLRLVARLDAGRSLVKGDMRFLANALRNIVDNALEAMTGRGTLTIATHNASGAELRADVSRDYLVVVVDDDGPGMDEAVHDKAFDLFYTTRAHTRHGLGLAQARDAIRRVGGNVAIEPRARGTTVTFAIPLALAGD
jgi:signal transduction histidine kinase